MKPIAKAKILGSAIGLRPGQRDTVDVLSQVMALPDGRSVAALGVDLSTAPVPERRYVSDLAGVVYRKGVVKLVFGQESLSHGLRSMIVIQMSAHATRNFLRSLEQMSHPTLDEIAAIVGVEQDELLPLDNGITEPDQTVAFAANMIGTTVVGTDVCFDVYNVAMSAATIAAVGGMNKMPIDSVVRVDLRLGLLLPIRNALRELESQFPPEFGTE